MTIQYVQSALLFFLTRPSVAFAFSFLSCFLVLDVGVVFCCGGLHSGEEPITHPMQPLEVQPLYAHTVTEEMVPHLSNRRREGDGGQILTA